MPKNETNNVFREDLAGNIFINVIVKAQAKRNELFVGRF